MPNVMCQAFNLAESLAGMDGHSLIDSACNREQEYINFMRSLMPSFTCYIHLFTIPYYTIPLNIFMG